MTGIDGGGSGGGSPRGAASPTAAASAPHPQSAAGRRGADGAEPLWREEVSIFAADEQYVGRRQFAKYLVLTSLGMLAGNLWILGKTLLRRRRPTPLRLPVATLSELPVGGSKLFAYPTADDPCLLVRHGENAWAAYSQRCTHLSCAVVWDRQGGRLACPCHHGYFAVEDGRVLQGPPPRPLPRIVLERRGDTLVAVGVAVDPGERPA